MGWKPDWEEEEWDQEDRLACLVAVFSLLTSLIIKTTLEEANPREHLKKDMALMHKIAARMTGGFEDELLERQVLERFSEIVNELESEAEKEIRWRRGGQAEMN
jgi:hypothetical protein